MMIEDHSQEELAIKRMLQASFEDQGGDLNIEDNILKQVYVQKDRSLELTKLRRKAKIGLSLAAVCLAIYVYQSFQWALPTTDDTLAVTGFSIFGIYLSVAVGVLIILIQGSLLMNGKVEVSLSD